MAYVLYEKERKTLEFIAQYVHRHGYSPTLKEIAEALGFHALSTAHEHIQSLLLKGYLKRSDGVKRGLEIVDQAIAKTFAGSDPTIELPLMGFISAGSPLEPHTDPHATFKVASNMVSPTKTAFILQVKGSSMIEDGILDGDYVVIEKTEEANNGDIVVALLENGLATIKRFYKEVDRIMLKPANSAMDPIYATNVRIQGKVVGLVRRF